MVAFGSTPSAFDSPTTDNTVAFSVAVNAESGIRTVVSPMVKLAIILIDLLGVEHLPKIKQKLVYGNNRGDAR
jgi:hypothetical protein